MVKGARELTLLMVMAGIWTFLVMFEPASATITDKIFWSKLTYLGAASTPVFYMIFVLRFTGKERLLSTKRIMFMFVIPAITLVLAITNENHNLIWSGFSPISPKTNLVEYHLRG